MSSTCDKKLARRRNKMKKMAALVNLSKGDEESSGSSSPTLTEHEQIVTDQMIASLENQMKETCETPPGCLKRLTPYEEANDGAYEDDHIVASYKQFMAKKRKTASVKQVAKFYIDQPYLSHCRLKNLLYKNSAPTLTTPIALYSSHVQELVMYSLFHRNSFYRPRWCSVQFVTDISQVMVLLLNDVSWLDVNVSMPSAWSYTRNVLSDHTIRVISPKLFGGNMEEDLFMVPLPVEEVANHQPKPKTDDPVKADAEVQLNMTALTDAADSFSRSQLLLSFADLVAEGYPVPVQSCGDNEHEFSTFKYSNETYSKVGADSPLFAIDCEMVTTNDHRLSLASVCIVDESLQVLYSTLVKPDKPIIDYLTRYSGMTAEGLAEVTTTLKDVQREIQQLLPSNAILCGHSLNNDLMAMQLFHPYVIDTSVCYNLKGMAHGKNSLKRLANQFLKKEIQQGIGGHCPQEDAVSTMQLVLLKLKIGYTFGNVLAGGALSTPAHFFTSKDTSSQLDGRESALGEDKLDTNKQEVVETRETDFIPQLNVFSRKHIPQMEVNMLDLIGHRDKNTAAVCSSSPSMRSPDNETSVAVHTCTKAKHVLKSCKQALKEGKTLVYGSISQSSNSKKHALAMDEKISKLWKCLSPGGLFCLLLGGTQHQHGSLMFSVKDHQPIKTLCHSDQSDSEDEMASAVYYE